MGRRGFISSLGAGLSLLAAGALALALMTSVVAFRDGSPLRPGEELSEIRLPPLPPAAPAAAVRDGDRERGAAGAVRLPGLGASPRREAATGGSSGETPAAQEVAREFRTRPEALAPVAAPTSPAPAPAPPSPSAPSGPVEDITRKVQGVVDPVVAGVDEAAGGLVGALP